MNIKILQLDSSNKEAESILFSRYDFAKKKYPNRDDLLKLYTVMYEIEDYTPVTMDKSVYVICEDIYYDFNMRRPEDFYGHSLSVSDIIEVDHRYFYVDSIGFKEV